MDRSAFESTRSAVSGYGDEWAGKLRAAEETMSRLTGLLDELRASEIAAAAAEGAVRVTVSGTGELRSVYISPGAVRRLDDAELSKAVRDALGQARLAAATAMREKVAGATGEPPAPPGNADLTASIAQQLRNALGR